MPNKTIAGTTTSADLTAKIRAVQSVRVIETGGTGPLKFYVRNKDAAGDVYIPLTCPAGGAVSFSFPTAINFPDGAFINVITDATYTGTARWAITGI